MMQTFPKRATSFLLMKKNKEITNYRRGVALEYETMRKLREAGMNVTRSAGSHGLFDVLGFDNSFIRMVQCKTTVKKTAFSVKTIFTSPMFGLEELYKAVVPPNATKELWIKQNRRITKILVL